jgi:hypothetical protein
LPSGEWPPPELAATVARTLSRRITATTVARKTTDAYDAGQLI